MRTILCSDIGNLAARPGSREWAVGVYVRAEIALKDSLTAVESLRDWLKILDEHDGMAALPNKKPIDLCKLKELVKELE